VIAGLADYARPAEKLSVGQSSALAATGLHRKISSHFCRTMLCISVSHAVVQCLSVTFANCVETATAKDMAIVAMECE